MRNLFLFIILAAATVNAIAEEPADTAFEGIRNLAAAANRLQIMYEDKQ